MYQIHLRKRILFFSFLICFYLGISTGSLIAAQDYWPTDGWRYSTPEAQGMDSQKLVEMMEYIRDNKYANMPYPYTKEMLEASGIDLAPYALNIDSITIVRNGYIVFDAFFYPFDKDSRHRIASCSKSITSMLVGIAVDKGYIKSVHQPLLEFFPNKTVANLSDQKKAITLENVLTMSSGLLNPDNAGNPNKSFEGTISMVQSNDWIQYLLDLPMARDPGIAFEYSSSCSQFLSGVISNSTNKSAFEFAKKYLFGPLGITDVVWCADPQEISYGPASLELRPHDMAKLGLLYLNNGQWENMQIVSKDWVQISTAKHIATKAHGVGYGYQWWNHGSYYSANGYGGQYIFVLPEKNMVAVFTGSMNAINAAFLPMNLLEPYIIPAAVSDQVLKDQPDNTDRLNTLLAQYNKFSLDGFTWESKENGMAKDGVFVRSDSPSFKFKYPKTYKIWNSEIGGPEGMWMRSPQNQALVVFVSDAPQQAALVDSINYDDFFKQNELGVVRKIHGSKKIMLKNGTPAIKAEIDFSNIGGPVKALAVSAFKEGKQVTLIYGYSSFSEEKTYNAKKMKEGESIIQSLEFN